MQTLADRIVEFYINGERPVVSDSEVSLLDPFGTETVQLAIRGFYGRYFSDELPRVAVFGINPGRFGGGMTGIPFTDPWALAGPCGIATTITGQRELSSEFIYQMIEQFGGAESFYGQFLITAVLPFGLVRSGKNLNYYDERGMMAELTPYIIRTMQTQIDFGLRRDVAVVLGGGKNFDYLSRLNAEHRFFDRLVPLDHPRFIMQYRRNRLADYLDQYVDTLRSVVGQASSAAAKT